MLWQRFLCLENIQEALKEMRPERTDKIVGLIKICGGELKSVHALLGEKDLIFIVDFQVIEQAIKASVILSKMIGI